MGGLVTMRLRESRNRLTLVVFAQNASGGSTMTTADGPPTVEWAETVEIAQRWTC
ncbi:MAG TPA: hypothetical protein VNC22_13800 [Sporichthya sp.]|jgi:hypothetical protein|nr:hypothetical protein [Sporichthya sp.]